MPLDTRERCYENREWVWGYREMVGKEIIEEVPDDGVIRLQIPEYSGRKVRIIFLPISENRDEEERLDFLADTYLAVVEDDEEEDAIWEGHIKKLQGIK